MKIINLTAVSATFELENESIYYNKDKFDVFLDGKIVIKDEKRNVFTIFNLNPNTEYEIKALDKTIKFKTKSVKKTYIIHENGLKDYTEYIQKNPEWEFAGIYADEHAIIGTSGENLVKSRVSALVPFNFFVKGKYNLI